MKTGCIGLGGMGGPRADHLLAAGHDLTLWSRRPASAEFLLARAGASERTP